jgi:hypothetical protein
VLAEAGGRIQIWMASRCSFALGHSTMNPRADPAIIVEAHYWHSLLPYVSAPQGGNEGATDPNR